MSQETIQLAICAVYNLFILCLGVTLVALYDWNPWWILGAVACFASPRSCFREEK